MAGLRQWGADFTAGLLAGVLAGILAGVALVVIIARESERVAETTLSANPSCAAPHGLRGARVTADVADADVESPRDRGHTTDRDIGSLWTPALTVDAEGETSTTFSAEGDANLLTLRLAEPAEVRLVCVVNGATLWFTSYQNFGRVRTVRAWGAESDDVKTTVLQSLGQDDFPNAQVAARNLGSTGVIHLEVVDSYPGHRVETFNARACLDDGDPTTTEATSDLLTYEDDQDYALAKPKGVHYRYEPGCILEPKPLAGLAEVYVYVKAD